MAEKLTDPSKPVHEIIEVLEDGDAIRNDGVRLTAANKNPWYVLATIYGEQDEGGGQSEGIRQQNVNLWNLWSGGGLLGDQLVNATERYRRRIGDETAEVPSWIQQINFSNTYFPNGLVFDGYKFCNTAIFDSSVFGGSVTFVSALFRGNANFKNAVFERTVNFNSVEFGESPIGGANFKNAYFRNDVYFRDVVFHEYANFQYVDFYRRAVFNSASFRSWTDFTKARFLTAVPEYHAAELFDDTVFPCRDQDQGNWPPLRKRVKVAGEWQNVMPAAEQKRAYNRLRLFMNKSLQLDEEQFFHRMEMRCKTRLARWYHKPLYWLYGGLSDFGNSVVRPIFGIGAVIAFGALFMLWWQGVFHLTPQEAGMDWTFGLMGKEDTSAAVREAFGWGVSNTLPFLGFGRLYYGGEFAANLDWPLRVVGGVQTLFGYALLFLFGLGLRNRFRLR